MDRRDYVDLAAIDRAIVRLSPEEFTEFLRRLGNPPPPNSNLVGLLRHKSIWDR